MKVPLDAKSYLVLKKLLVSNTFLNTKQLASDLDISKRSVYYALSRINNFLLNAGIAQIETERKLGILLHDQHKKQIERSLEQIVEADTYLLSPMERVLYITCLIIYNRSDIFIDDLVGKVKVSRNTIFSDLKVVESKLLAYELQITFNQKDGYQIKGDTINKRAIFLYNVQLLLPLYNSGIIEFVNDEKVDVYYSLLKRIEEALNVKYVSGTLRSLSILIESYIANQEEINFADLDADEIKETPEFDLVTEHFPMLIESEQYYLAIHLLGARLQVVPIFSKSAVFDREIYQIANDLKLEFERLACLNFVNEAELLEALYVHLKMSMFRYKYGIVLENPLADEIMKNYSELFTLTKKACDYLQQQIGIPISDGEIAYIALHFGSFLRQQEKKALRILVVCPNGVATGNMLKREITELIPTAEIVDVLPSSNTSSVHGYCDLIISTVQLHSDVPTIVVHPILTDNDRLLILNYSLNTKNQNRKTYDIEDIYQTFQQYIKEEEEERFKNALISYFGQKDLTFTDSKVNLLSLLNSEKITFIKSSDWREAIKASALPLLSQKRITEEYVNKMISEVENYGPYNFLTEGVVLAHAKPIEVDSNLDVSIGICKEGVAFSKQKKAYIILVLSVEQQESHLNVLKDIMTLFSIQTHVEQLTHMKNADDALTFIKEQLAD